MYSLACIRDLAEVPPVTPIAMDLCSMVVSTHDHKVYFVETAKALPPLDMTPAHLDHAGKILTQQLVFSGFRFDVCPSVITDEKFWRAYFTLLAAKRTYVRATLRNSAKMVFDYFHHHHHHHDKRRNSCRSHGGDDAPGHGDHLSSCSSDGTTTITTTSALHRQQQQQQKKQNLHLAIVHECIATISEAEKIDAEEILLELHHGPTSSSSPLPLTRSPSSPVHHQDVKVKNGAHAALPAEKPWKYRSFPLGEEEEEEEGEERGLSESVPNGASCHEELVEENGKMGKSGGAHNGGGIISNTRFFSASSPPPLVHSPLSSSSPLTASASSPSPEEVEEVSFHPSATSGGDVCGDPAQQTTTNDLQDNNHHCNHDACDYFTPSPAARPRQLVAPLLPGLHRVVTEGAEEEQPQPQKKLDFLAPGEHQTQIDHANDDNRGGSSGGGFSTNAYYHPATASSASYSSIVSLMEKMLFLEESEVGRRTNEKSNGSSSVVLAGLQKVGRLLPLLTSSSSPQYSREGCRSSGSGASGAVFLNDEQEKEVVGSPTHQLNTEDKEDDEEEEESIVRRLIIREVQRDIQQRLRRALFGWNLRVEGSGSTTIKANRNNGDDAEGGAHHGDGTTTKFDDDDDDDTSALLLSVVPRGSWREEEEEEEEEEGRIMKSKKKGHHATPPQSTGGRSERKQETARVTRTLAASKTRNSSSLLLGIDASVGLRALLPPPPLSGNERGRRRRVSSSSKKTMSSSDIVAREEEEDCERRLNAEFGNVAYYC